MSLLACYGGSFDPVHLGHLAVARAVRDVCGAEVALLPAADPPHKAGTYASAAQRVRMLELAVAGEPGLSVDARELDREGPSYTRDTLHLLRQEHGPGRPIAWVVGGDAVLQLAGWHRWRELFSLGHVLAYPRPGFPLGDDDIARRAPLVAAEVRGRRRSAATLAETPAGGFAVLAPGRLRPESSTEVRLRIAAGSAWEAMLPPDVAAFIRVHRLFGYTGP